MLYLNLLTNILIHKHTKLPLCRKYAVINLPLQDRKVVKVKVDKKQIQTKIVMVHEAVKTMSDMVYRVYVRMYAMIIRKRFYELLENEPFMHGRWIMTRKKSVLDSRLGQEWYVTGATSWADFATCLQLLPLKAIVRTVREKANKGTTVPTLGTPLPQTTNVCLNTQDILYGTVFTLWRDGFSTPVNARFPQKSKTEWEHYVERLQTQKQSKVTFKPRKDSKKASVERKHSNSKYIWMIYLSILWP